MKHMEKVILDKMIPSFIYLIVKMVRFLFEIHKFSISIDWRSYSSSIKSNGGTAIITTWIDNY